jgi:transcriptional regulator of arginine metabolism
MTKQQRQQLILQIIAENDCCRQEDLQLALEKHGVVTTQATISRDIRQMGLIKTQLKPGVYTYAAPDPSNQDEAENPFAGIFSHSVLKVDYAINTVVVKCRTGMANAACAALDSMEFDSIVGTLAGDDTIFILMRTELDAKSICAKLEELRR